MDMAEDGSLTTEGVTRWACNTTLWTPSDAHFHVALAILPPSEWASVLRFSSEGDRKQALVSRLMQQKLIHDVLGVELENVRIERTPEGCSMFYREPQTFNPAKCRDFPPLDPNAANQLQNARFPDLNFNVSHHGDYVVIVSEPASTVGVDIMRHHKHSGLISKELFALHVTSFTPFEWETIRSGGPDARGMLDQFYRHWCMKEAYIKALGIGVGFEPLRAEFHYHEDQIWGDMACVYVDGIYEARWQFFLHKVDSDHWICVAKGPPAVCATKGGYIDDDKPCHDVGTRDTSFTILGVEDVLKQSWSCSPSSD